MDKKIFYQIKKTHFLLETKNFFQKGVSNIKTATPPKGTIKFEVLERLAGAGLGGYTKLSQSNP